MNTNYYLYILTPREPDFDQKLADYLAEATTIRGFQVTPDHVENALALYGSELNDFKTVDELSGFLGEIIYKDLSNVGPYFEMNTEDVLQLISDNGLDINSYVFLDDLFNDLDGEVMWEEDFFDLSFFMEEFDLTEDELLRLEEHIRSIPDITSDETIARMLNLAERMVAFSDFEKATELTPGQATELLSIFHELIDIFQFHVEFVLVTDEGEEPITLQTLFSLTKLENADLKANIYNLQGDFLADLIISGEIVDSNTIVDTGNAIQKEADKKTEPSVITSPDKEPPATEETSYVKESPKTAAAEVDIEAASPIPKRPDISPKCKYGNGEHIHPGIARYICLFLGAKVEI